MCTCLRMNETKTNNINNLMSFSNSELNYDISLKNWISKILHLTTFWAYLFIIMLINLLTGI